MNEEEKYLELATTAVIWLASTIIVLYLFFKLITYRNRE